MKTIIALILSAFFFTSAANATVVGQQNMEGICLPLKNFALISIAFEAVKDGKPNVYEVTLDDITPYMMNAVSKIASYTGKTPDYVLHHLADYALSCVDLMKEGEDDSVSAEPMVPAPDPSIDENPPVITYQQVQPTTPMQRFKARAVTSASKAQCGTNPTLIANDGRQEVYQSRANNSGKTCTIVCTANTSQCAVTKQ